MKFTEVLPALLAGKRIYRICWNTGYWKISNGLLFCLDRRNRKIGHAIISKADLEASDWAEEMEPVHRRGLKFDL